MIHTCIEHEPSATCYRRHGCRCDGCGRDFRRRKKLSRNGMCGMVDAEPVRRHILALQARGYSASGIASAAGVGNQLVEYALTTARKVHADTARKLLAVEVPAGLVDATGTRRRMQALAAIGWTFSELSARLGCDRTQVHHWTTTARVTQETAATARRLYDELWNVEPPECMGATRNRSMAASKGWAPPLAWDDDEIDDPAATPHEWQRIKRSTNRRDDLVEAAELGAPLASLIERFGIGAKGVERALFRAGRNDLWRRIVPREEGWAA